MGEIKTINDPVHGTIRFEGALLNLLGSPQIIRLNQIKQLGLAYLVFPGAQHTRLEHSMGVSFVAGLLARELGLGEEEAAILRAAGLLHDVGHGPFSHTLEGIFHDRIGLDHMELTRDLITGRVDLDLSEWTDPSWDARRIPDILERHGLDPGYIASLVCQEKNGGIVGLRLSMEEEAGDDTPQYMRQIIHSALDADQLDFLLRDSHYTGAAHGTIDIDRIVQTAILVNGELMIHKRGISALEGMLVARSLMYSSVYFHKTSRIAESMLCRAASRLDDERLLGIWNLSDAEVLYTLRKEEGLTGDIVRRLRMRRLFKAAFRIESEDALGDDELSLKTREIVREASDDRARTVMEDRIARRAGVKEGHVIIDVPDPALTLSEPRLKRMDIKVMSERPTPLSKLSSIARSLQHRPTVPWCMMISCPEEKVAQVSDAASRVLEDL